MCFTVVSGLLTDGPQMIDCLRLVKTNQNEEKEKAVMKNKLVIRMLTVALISGMAVPQTVLPLWQRRRPGLKCRRWERRIRLIWRTVSILWRSA